MHSARDFVISMPITTKSIGKPRVSPIISLNLFDQDFKILLITNIQIQIQNFIVIKQVWTQKCAVQKASVDVNISYCLT